MKCAKRSLVASLLMTLLPSVIGGQIRAQEVDSEHGNGPLRVTNTEFPSESFARVTSHMGAPIFEPEIDGSAAFVSVEGGALLSDGAFVVADGGQSKVYAFGGDGEPTWSAGRDGEGPGEFREIKDLWVTPGDTVMVFDRALQRVTILNRRGEFLSSHRVRSPRSLYGKVGRFSDGSWYARDIHRARRGAPGSILVDTIQFRLLDTGFSEGSRLLSVPASKAVSLSLYGQTVYRATPFTPYPVYDEVGRCLFVSNAESFDLHAVNSQGQIALDVSNRWARVAVDEDTEELWREQVLDVVPEQERALASTILDEMPMPDSLPAYHSLTADDQGYLWLALYRPPVGVGKRWLVLSVSGTPSGLVEFPRPGELLSVQGDIALMRVANEVGEQAIVRYRLERVKGTARVGLLEPCRS